MESFDIEAFQKELALANGEVSSSSSESESEDLTSESSSEQVYCFSSLFLSFRKEDQQQEVPELTEEQIIAARQERYGRRRSHSIDYGGRANNAHDYEQVRSRIFVPCRLRSKLFTPAHSK